jgi:hypothetical protein|nr:MAG TPA: hypothetical protein [Caudoviricetes sp.]
MLLYVTIRMCIIFPYSVVIPFPLSYFFYYIRKIKKFPNILTNALKLLELLEKICKEAS